MDERLKQLLVLGREHYERREYDPAERALRQVLEHTDRYADVFNMLAVISHDRGDFVAAESFFERAVADDAITLEAELHDGDKVLAKQTSLLSTHTGESGTPAHVLRFDRLTGIELWDLRTPKLSEVHVRLRCDKCKAGFWHPFLPRNLHPAGVCASRIT